MRKIFLYECKRLLWNKFFGGLLLVLLFYGWQVLSRVTILGVSHTAPFSPWSFGDYLSRMLPLLWIGMLFFLTFYTSPKPGGRQFSWMLHRCHPSSTLWSGAPQLTGGVLLSLPECMGRGGSVLRPHVWLVRLGQSPAPGPGDPSAALVFALGRWLAVRPSPALAGLCMMVVPFGCMALPLPDALKIWNGQFFGEYH